MKNILLIFVLCLSLLSEAQFPINTPQGNSSTLNYDVGARGANIGFVFRANFPDTASANIYSINIKGIPGMQIMVGDTTYIRNRSATAWLNQMRGGGGSGSFPGIDDVLSVGQPLTTNRTIQGNSLTTSLLFQTPITLAKSLYVSGVLTPDAITGNTNNYNPPGLDSASTLRLSSTGAVNITGLQGGTEGRIIVIQNVGSNNITLVNLSGSSTASNRFYFLDNDIVLREAASVTLRYDGTDNVWRTISTAVSITQGYGLSYSTGILPITSVGSIRVDTTQLKNQFWSLRGNASGAGKFLGFTDSADFYININSIRAGWINTDPGGSFYGGNTTFGFRAGISTTGSSGNTLLGYYVYPSATGTQNVLIGAYSGWAASGTPSENVGVGDGTLGRIQGIRNAIFGTSGMAHATTADQNSGGGNYVLLQNRTGDANTALGSSALRGNAEGSNNTAVGGIALTQNTTGVGSISVTNGGSGYTTATVVISAPTVAIDPNNNSLQATATATIDGGVITAVTVTNQGKGYVSPVTATITGDGSGAVLSVTLISGEGNTALGASAGALNRTGSYNLFLGNGAGSQSTYGSYNVFLGGYVGSTNNISRSIYVSDGAGTLRMRWDSAGRWFVPTVATGAGTMALRWDASTGQVFAADTSGGGTSLLFARTDARNETGSAMYFSAADQNFQIDSTSTFTVKSYATDLSNLFEMSPAGFEITSDHATNGEGQIGIAPSLVLALANDGVTVPSFEVDAANKWAQLRSSNVALATQESRLRLLPDSVRLYNYLGRYNIDTIRRWSAVADTAFKKPMTWDTRNGRWEVAESWWAGSGTGTVTSFSFSDANGFDGTVTNSTTTPELELAFASELDGLIIYSNSGAATGVTIGSGLDFTGGVLSATGGGSGTVTSVALSTGTTGTDVNVSGSPITTSGTITLNIPDASATARGLMTTGTQTIAGAKTFSSSVTTPLGTFTTTLAAAATNAGNFTFIGGSISASTSTSNFLVESAGGTNYRQLFYGSTATTLTANNNYGTIIMGNSAITEAASGTHPLISTMILRAPAITGGSAAVTNAATLYIEGDPSATVTGGTYSIMAGGTLRFFGYGAGTMTTDASGIVSVTSDGRLKNIKAPFSAGLKEVMQINPIVYSWKQESGHETSQTYAGFDARNIHKVLGEYGAPTQPSGYYGLNDRALIAMLINAIKSQQKQIDQLKRRK